MNLDFIDHKMVITLEPGDAETLQEELDAGTHTDEQIVHEALEYYWTNGYIEGVRPEEVGALTDSPLYTTWTERNNDGDLTDCGPVYWFPDYAVVNFVEHLIRHGELIFVSPELQK